MKTIYRVFIPPPEHTKNVFSSANAYTLEDICERAGYTVKVTGHLTPKILLLETDNQIALNEAGHEIYVVDVRGMNLDTVQGWEMILETLAYAFFDYATRETVRHT